MCLCGRGGEGRETALCLDNILHICVSGSVAFAPAARESRRSREGLFCFVSPQHLFYGTTL